MSCAGVLALADMRKLKSLEMRECKKVSKELIETLQSRLPALVDVQYEKISW